MGSVAAAVPLFAEVVTAGRFATRDDASDDASAHTSRIQPAGYGVRGGSITDPGRRLSDAQAALRTLRAGACGGSGGVAALAVSVTVRSTTTPVTARAARMCAGDSAASLPAVTSSATLRRRQRCGT